MELEFRGQKLIVVGGTSGIGNAVAKIVLEHGGTAVLIGRREDKTKKAIAGKKDAGSVHQQGSIAVLGIETVHKCNSLGVVRYVRRFAEHWTVRSQFRRAASFPIDP